MLIQSGITRNKILVTFLRATQNLVDGLGISRPARGQKKRRNKALGEGRDIAATAAGEVLRASQHAGRSRSRISGVGCAPKPQA
jgi:hypothetical protein